MQEAEGELGGQKRARKSQAHRSIQVGKGGPSPVQAAPARMSDHDAGEFIQWRLESLRGWRPQIAWLHSLASATLGMVVAAAGWIPPRHLLFTLL